MTPEGQKQAPFSDRCFAIADWQWTAVMLSCIVAERRRHHETISVERNIKQ